MKTYKWAEVLNFLKENLETEFNYAFASSSQEDSCLMSQFFKNKLGEDCVVSVCGWTAFEQFEKAGKRVKIAEIKNPPFKRVADIHMCNDTGEKIFNKFQELQKREEEIQRQREGWYKVKIK